MGKISTRKKSLNIIKNDPWLEPYSQAILGRYDYAKIKEERLTKNVNSLSDFANGFVYFGLNKTDKEWTFREWAPNATAIYLIGDFNDWMKIPEFKLTNIGNGVWEIKKPLSCIKHEQLYKMIVEWEGGYGEKIPSYANRVVQDPKTTLFSAQVWNPEHIFKFKKTKFKPKKEPLLIYECHIGMATEEEKIGTYNEFRENILPIIAKQNYNAIQIMAIQEHPYYGSFGYHVSNFFAPSSRFGTPEELKQLIDTAHELRLSVIMDIVHSHAVKNINEGLNELDGTSDLYFKGMHPAWDSMCFNYAKDNVVHFLLSNCKYWLEEFKFDGFRFDGVTSMLYYNHAIDANFNNYKDYFNGNQDGEAICYLTLANKLIHEINPRAITIAEEVSGMPGVAVPFADGGIGFDYRLAMGLPDFWIKLIKEYKDEDWKPGMLWWELTNRRANEKNISYAESHDQALVGDKTIIFRLIDSEMYWHMSKNDNNFIVERGIALHKIIRFLTATTINGGYLNFMGNEFGHPEWIDFPRKENNWSYKYARRQWNLVRNKDLKYEYLNNFDIELMTVLSKEKQFAKNQPVQRCLNDGDQVLSYQRGDLLFVVNIHPYKSYTNYGILVPKGKYKSILDSDSEKSGGHGLINDNIEHITQPGHEHGSQLEWLNIYIPARTAIILKNIAK